MSDRGLPIYYINLASRPDRREHIESELAKVGLRATRINAVTPADLSPDDLDRYCNKSRPRYLMPAALSCTKSHIKAWHCLIDETRADWALILEDDAVLSTKLPSFLDEFLASPPPVDIVQLHWNKHVRILPAIRTMVCGVQLHPFRSTLAGTNAYLISREAAARLLKRSDLFRQPADTMLFRPYLKPGSTLQSVLTEPAVADQLWIGSNPLLGRSDIDDARGWDGATRGRIGRALISAANAIDHLVHLPLGLRRKDTGMAR